MVTTKPAAAAPALYIPPPSTLAALPDPQVGLDEVLKLLLPDDAALHRVIA
ncbi:hypothetical protein K2Z83_15700 [Oscillochloris sp. ZM17-4]|uniref:hypothetical protein n=1 Tax=Oscillochloris sp. ZM17-4 TaxID=2866714 RepID=UPI001C72F88E|nr:hypothetical protein [Oscillochloris sp. ZM17-4]MBX0329122.1 hypothetical protein [Oscillochloris sp. ZM17-4]